MSASPTTSAMPSQKRPLEEPSSPSGPGDQPDAKRPALDKVIKDNGVSDEAAVVPDSLPTQSQAKTEEMKLENGSDGAHQSSDPAPTTAIDTEVLANAANTGGDSGSNTDQKDERDNLHLRAIISSAEAATVIGKGGENVTLIRRMSNAKCTVSDYARGAVERILTVTGQVDAVAKVFSCLSLSMIMLT
jgi:heterogeneous nuclear rnp K-like protein